jgi:alkaline phosphatase
MRKRHLRIALVMVALVVAALVVGSAVTAGAGKAAADPNGAPDFSGVKNVILFIGDGMADAHLEVGRQLNGGSLMMDSMWQAEGYSDTTSLDGVTDSAAGGTALSTGNETWNNWVAMGPADPDNPSKDDVEPWKTVLELAQDRELYPDGNVGPKGPHAKAVGLITDLELSDATPAVFTAHVEDRDEDVAITEQMRAHDIETLFSGGWGSSSILKDPVVPGVTYVSDLRQLSPYLNGGDWPQKMYGIFGKTTLAYTLDREEEGVLRKQPTLPQLTEAALEILSQDDDGFFVMIENGSNDWGGSARDAAWVGAEIRELDQAVMTAKNWVENAGLGDDTLIVVTADHECGGLSVDNSTRYDLIAKQKATTEWMWGLIKSGKMTIRKTLETYAGFSPTLAEQALIAKNKEMGISDVLAARFHVKWGWSGTDEGDHTATMVPVKAWGPGAEAFGTIQGDDSEWVGRFLLQAVSQ